LYSLIVAGLNTDSCSYFLGALCQLCVVFVVSLYTGWSKSLCAPDFFFGVRWKTQCIRTFPTQLMIWRWPSQNTFGMWTVLYWTRSLRTQFGMSINVCWLMGDTLNIKCNFLYCNHLPCIYHGRMSHFNPFRSYVRPRPTLSFSCSRRFCSCTGFNQQITQVVLFLFLSFKTVG
jgi:hypothetical protein